MFMEERPINYGTHVTHCCGKHGCKYGDQRCPVQAGTHKQEYACPMCMSIAEIDEEIARLLAEKAWTQALEAETGRTVERSERY